MERELKRYIFEMCSDFFKRYKEAGKLDSALRVDKIRDAYICRIITEIGAIKAIVEEEEKQK